jgi:hypothetical protein
MLVEYVRILTLSIPDMVKLRRRRSVASAVPYDFTMAAASSNQPFLSAASSATEEYYSDSSVSSDNDNSQLDLNSDLVHVRRALKELKIINAYRPYWTSKEAFREA